ncbi:MAG: 30S ribosomal protein S1 [Thermodesulfobacteriota bacterium]
MGASRIITIDGPAGAGKSTVAKLLAAGLDYLYLDSGAFYRLVALQAARRNLDLSDTPALHAFLEGLHPEVTANAQEFTLVVDGEEVSRVLREPWVSQESSRVAVLPPVREWVTARLRYLARDGGVVAEGRDLGSVVFPQAEVKFFLTAALETRAARRRQEWQDTAAALSPEEVARELAERDRRDATRAEAPMRAPAEALVIDTTALNPQEVVRLCLARIREILPETSGLDNENRLTGVTYMDGMEKTELTINHTQPEEEEIRSPAPEVPAEEAQAEVAQAEEARAEEVMAEETMESSSESLAEIPEMSDMETMSELYEESLRRVQEGEVVKGRIVSIAKDFVMVDIGYKSEGQIPIHEFTNAEGEITAQVGDTVEALLESREDEEGALMLSKNKASKIKVWEEISYAYHHDGMVEGAVVAKVKGGLSVDLGGVIGFLPGSQVDLTPMRHTDHLIGQRFTFKVLKFNRKRRNVVLSRRHLLEKAKSEAKATLLATLEEDKVLEGVVKNITDYGIFVDLGGLDGLLHITDLSYGRVRHPADLFKVGDPITVKVLSFDREKERISLGLKQLTPDPWTTVGEKYPLGSRVSGKVVSLTDYGAFVELEPGVEGLIHISEMSWTRKIRHPSQILTVGDVVESTVLELEPQRKRISLSLKQVEPNPWEVIGEKYPVGSVIEGKIKNITDFGIFIGIDEGIDGLVHISDISWTKRFKHPSELYKKGQVVQAKVLFIDKDNERFSLSIKDLNPNPWQSIDMKFPVNSMVTGPITNITDFGLFVEVEEGIEGLVHISEMGRDKQRMAALKVGDLIKAKVIHSSPTERRIGLSIRRLETDEEQSHYRDYLHNRQEATSNLGEILRERLENLEDSDLKKLKNNG